VLALTIVVSETVNRHFDPTTFGNIADFPYGGGVESVAPKETVVNLCINYPKRSAYQNIYRCRGALTSFYRSGAKEE
jgi:hypothetical protein